MQMQAKRRATAKRYAVTARFRSQGVTPFDIADYLETEDEITTFLEVMLQGDEGTHGRITSRALATIARARARMASNA